MDGRRLGRMGTERTREHARHTSAPTHHGGHATGPAKATHATATESRGAAVPWSPKARAATETWAPKAATHAKTTLGQQHTPTTHVKHTQPAWANNWKPGGTHAPNTRNTIHSRHE